MEPKDKVSSFHLVKSWVNPINDLLWQVRGVVDGGVPVRGFLMLTKKPPYFVFSTKKPEDEWDSEKGPGPILRKHIPRGKVVGYHYNEDLGQSLLLIQSASLWGIALQEKVSHLSEKDFSEPYFELIDCNNRLSYTRWGNGFTYTKRKSYMLPLPGDTRAAEDSSTFEKINLWGGSSQTLMSKGIESPRENEQVASSSDETLRQKIRDRLKRKLKTLRKSLAKLHEKQTEPGEVDDLSKKIHLWLHDDLFFEKPDFGHLLDQAYKELKKKKKSVGYRSKLELTLLKEIKHIQDQLKDLHTYASSDLRLLQKQFNINLRQSDAKKKQDKPSTGFYDYTFPEGRVLVGKNASGSDELVKAAKGNDLWFHAVNARGSHVIVPLDKALSSDPKRMNLIQRYAMILALFHSKQKESFSGEVYRGTRDCVKKVKHLAEGMWLINEAKSSMVRYTQAELDELMARTQS